MARKRRRVHFYSMWISPSTGIPRNIRLACWGFTISAIGMGPTATCFEALRTWAGTHYTELTTDREKVTCPRCLDVIADEVAHMIRRAG